jgi:hypothetical protein
MTRSWLLLPLLCFASLSCGYRERGKFAAVAAVPPSGTYASDAVRVVGSACFSGTAEFGADHVIDRALRDALSRAPGTDALAKATVVDEGSCIKVHGYAIRVAP